MNLDKYVSLLRTRSLWFSRLDEFDDQHEGWWYEYGDGQAETVDMLLRSFARESTTASCWRSDASLSQRAWREYTDEGSGIAIKTDVESLKSSLNGTYMVTLVPVEYSDEPADAQFRLFDSLAHIRTKSAEHAWEQEVRVFDVSQHMLLTDLITEGEIAHMASLVNILSRPLRARSHLKEVNLSTLVKEVWVSPRMDARTSDCVRSITHEHGLQVPVTSADTCV